MMKGQPVPVHQTAFVVGRGAPKNNGPLDGRGRRTIYTAVRRNFIPTLMLTFDFLTPFSTVGRRTVTNVPAQSLALMNDPFVFQQSLVWAQRIRQSQTLTTRAARIRQMVLECYGRHATEDEVKACVGLLQQSSQARKITIDSDQVWRDLAHALFSVNDFIYVR